jgi:large subunit ribosomal protein L13
MSDKKTVVIDAKHGILGRVASFAAKQALKGFSVAIINTDDVLVTGRIRWVIEEYQTKRKRGGSAQNGPNFPSDPARIVKRTVRGMLPYKQGRGLEALKRVYCYGAVPKQYESEKAIAIVSTTKAKTMTLKELCSEI